MRLLELFYLLFYEDPHKSGQECYEIKVNSGWIYTDLEKIDQSQAL